MDYYSNCVKPFMAALPPEYPVTSLTLNDLQLYALQLRQRPLASNSVKSYIKGIKAFVSWLHAEEYTAENLAAKFKLPKAQRKAIDVLTDTEISLMFKSFDTRKILGLRDYCICALMIDSGLRKSEVVGLRLGDMHTAEGYLIVNGKGNKQRVVPFGLRTQKHLLKYLAFRPAFSRNEGVFLTDEYTPITKAVIERLFKKLKQGLFTPRIRAHLLRHTFATRYLENGGNIYALQQILGHTSLDMVKKYVHLTTRKNVVNFKDYSPLDNLP
jgi:integrase/recombinase XerC/integrase/recombinase XerD